MRILKESGYISPSGSTKLNLISLLFAKSLLRGVRGDRRMDYETFANKVNITISAEGIDALNRYTPCFIPMYHH
jgi:hypothetical protein